MIPEHSLKLTGTQSVVEMLNGGNKAIRSAEGGVDAEEIVQVASGVMRGEDIIRNAVESSRSSLR